MTVKNETLPLETYYVELPKIRLHCKTCFFAVLNNKT